MTEISSESDTSSLHHAEIYNDEFLGTSVYYRDRELFIDAASQLMECNSTGIKHSLGFPFRRHDSNSNRSVTSPSYNKEKGGGHHKVHEVKPDLLRFGRLEKSSDRSTQLQSKWKKKLVELKYGLFIYEDDVDVSNGTASSGYGILSTVSTSSSYQLSKKTIILAADTCTCKARKKKGSKEDFAFELAITSEEGKVKRRYFRASSTRDLDAWIEAIKAAMMLKLPKGNKLRRRSVTNASPLVMTVPSPRPYTRGSVNGQQASPGAGTTASTRNARRRTITLSNGIESQSSQASTKSGSPGKRALQQTLLTPELLYASETSLPGPAVFHADNVAVFCGVRNSLSRASSVRSYEKLIRRLAADLVEVQIPVYFVKSAFHHAKTGACSNFTAAAEDMSTFDTSIRGPSGIFLNGQVFKDFQRDSVNINGTILIGQRDGGALGVLNALRGEIQLQARRIIEESYKQMDDEVDSKHMESVDLLKMPFLLSDRDAEACAKDILILCNRTQSGGDSYFCVDALLAKCGLDSIVNTYQNRFAVLTPFENESAPVCISIDTVDSESGQVGHRHSFVDSIRGFVEAISARRLSTPTVHSSLRNSKDTGSETEDSRGLGTATALARHLNKFSFRGQKHSDAEGESSPCTPPQSAASMINQLREQEMASFSELSLPDAVDSVISELPSSPGPTVESSISSNGARPKAPRPVSLPARLSRSVAADSVLFQGQYVTSVSREGSQDGHEMNSTDFTPKMHNSLSVIHLSGKVERPSSVASVEIGGDVNLASDGRRSAHKHMFSPRPVTAVLHGSSSSDYTSLTSSDEDECDKDDSGAASPRILNRGESMYTRSGSPYSQPGLPPVNRRYSLRNSAPPQAKKVVSVSGKSPSITDRQRSKSIAGSPRSQGLDHFGPSTGKSPAIGTGTISSSRGSLKMRGGPPIARAKKAIIDGDEVPEKQDTIADISSPQAVGISNQEVDSSGGGRGANLNSDDDLVRQRRLSTGKSSVDNDGRVRFKLFLDLEEEATDSTRVPSPSRLNTTIGSDSLTLGDHVSSTSRALDKLADESGDSKLSVRPRLDRPQRAQSPKASSQIFRKTYTSDDIINVGDIQLGAAGVSSLRDVDHNDGDASDVWSDLEHFEEFPKSMAPKRKSLRGSGGAQISNGKQLRRRTLSGDKDRNELIEDDGEFNISMSARNVRPGDTADYGSRDEFDPSGTAAVELPLSKKKSKSFFSRIKNTISSPFTPNRKPDRFPMGSVSARGESVPWNSSLRRDQQSPGLTSRSVDVPLTMTGSPTVDSIAARMGLFSKTENRTPHIHSHHQSQLQSPVLGNEQSQGDGSQVPPLALPEGEKELVDDGPCIRVIVGAKSKYKLCCADPQGDFSDNWAIIHAEFTQVFYIHSNCKGRTNATDRLVTINLESPIEPEV